VFIGIIAAVLAMLFYLEEIRGGPTVSGSSADSTTSLLAITVNNPDVSDLN